MSAKVGGTRNLTKYLQTSQRKTSNEASIQRLQTGELYYYQFFALDTKIIKGIEMTAIDETEIELMNMSQEEMEQIANGEDE